MKTIPIIRIQDGTTKKISDNVADEVLLKIIVNQERIAEFSCGGTHLNELVMGYLYHYGYIKTPTDVASMEYDVSGETVYIELSATSRSYLNGLVRGSVGSCSPRVLFSLMQKFMNLSDRFQKTGAVHSAAVASEDSIIASFDDLSRHNTLFMLLGYSILENVVLHDKILLLTCRLTKSIMDLILKSGVRVIITKAAPTYRAVQTCAENDIALAGFVRGNRMNIYHGEARFMII